MARTSLDLRTLAGQLLTFGFDGASFERLRSALKTLKPGGIILFARNIESPRQTHALLKAAQKEAEIPLFRCVDMEGGTVDRLKDVIAPAPSVQEVVAGRAQALLPRTWATDRQRGASFGLQRGFCPGAGPALPGVAGGAGIAHGIPDAKATVAYAKEFLRGLKDVEIAGCGKHFPGLGEGTLDSHEALPVVHKSWKALWDGDLVPYRVLAKRLPFVMVAHCAYPEVTGDAVPASISKKWIGDVLRKKIGYTGLIVSDDLEMGGVLKVASIEEAAVGTVHAGADMYLVCHNEELVHRAYEAILKEAERSSRFRAKVEAAAQRIMKAKTRWPGLKKKMMAAPTDAGVNRLRQKLWEFSEEVRLTTNARVAKAAG